MHVIALQHTFDGLDAKLITNLPDNIANTYFHLPRQYLVTALGDPNVLAAMIENGVYAGVVGQGKY